MNVTPVQFITGLVIATAFPTLTALIGILVSNGRFNDLGSRIEDLGASMLQHRNQIHSDIQTLIGWERKRHSN